MMIGAYEAGDTRCLCHGYFTVKRNHTLSIDVLIITLNKSQCKGWERMCLVFTQKYFLLVEIIEFIYK